MNKPMLFVNSVSVEHKDNKVEVYDSRNAKKKANRIHRLDDVEAFMKLGKKVFATIMTKYNNISGEIKSISEKNLLVGNTKVLINDILELTINLVKWAYFSILLKIKNKYAIMDVEIGG